MQLFTLLSTALLSCYDVWSWWMGRHLTYVFAGQSLWLAPVKVRWVWIDASAYHCFLFLYISDWTIHYLCPQRHAADVVKNGWWLSVLHGVIRYFHTPWKHCVSGHSYLSLFSLLHHRTWGQTHNKVSVQTLLKCFLPLETHFSIHVLRWPSPWLSWELLKDRPPLPLRVICIHETKRSSSTSSPKNGRRCSISIEISHL